MYFTEKNLTLLFTHLNSYCINTIYYCQAQIHSDNQTWKKEKRNFTWHKLNPKPCNDTKVGKPGSLQQRLRCPQKPTQFGSLAQKADDDSSVTTADGAVQRAHAVLVHMLYLCPLVHQVLNLKCIMHRWVTEFIRFLCWTSGHITQFSNTSADKQKMNYRVVRFLGRTTGHTQFITSLQTNKRWIFPKMISFYFNAENVQSTI